MAQPPPAGNISIPFTMATTLSLITFATHYDYSSSLDGEPCVFFKPKKQNQNTRKRKTEEESAATSEDKVEIVKPVTQPTKKADNSFSVFI